ncbi:MAG TPA: FAD-dependent oxidoreductase [Bacteroidia bacterium]|nr:FAD-dependent oxidoreductase [Bacteroidia bacterium]HRS58149.1 FAD-dependent oxidoreductase [Bacteroidia bacterium]HRU67479.1 FAD-dependent oxidoreductase [Bacteroidia bacterium]
MKKKVLVIGGGIAGIEASAFLSNMGFDVTLVEKEEKVGGHLNNWEKLFPTMRYGSEVLDFLKQGLNGKVKVLTSSELEKIERIEDQRFDISISSGLNETADAILVTTGYELFDARKKEEYGYGIYENVITSADLEGYFNSNREVRTSGGKIPERIGFVHCVGSRDEKVGNVYCSKVCCVTAVKQSIEIKQKYPDCEVFCFYMDLRMYGMHFEHLFKEAQEKYGVQFIRGRLSEAFENQDKSVLIKVEDTLLNRPLKMSVDLLVLMVGFVPAQGTLKIGRMLGLENGINGFFKTRDQHTLTNVSNVQGVFFAGCCTSPKTITNTITDARAAASTIAAYLLNCEIDKRTVNTRK